MTSLIASLFSLCVGPLIYQTFGPLRRTDKIASGIVLVIIVGIVLFETIPTSFTRIGYIAIALSIIGFIGPTLIEKTFHRAADTTHKLTIYLGIVGLLFHAFIDGAAIQANQDQHSTDHLTLAIILHRLPVGLTIWWLLKPLLGEKYALITLGLMAASTCTGYFINQSFPISTDSSLFSILQAFISGSLLHVVIHKPHSDGCLHTSHTHKHKHSHINHESGKWMRYITGWESIGVLIGLIILYFLNSYH